MRPIAIDATPAARIGTGIHRATVGLLAGLSEIGIARECVGIVRWLLGPRRISLPGNFESVRIRLPRCAEPWMRATRWVERRAGASLYHATDFYLPLGPDARWVCTVHDVLFLTDPDLRSVDHDRLRRWAPDYVRGAEAVLTPSERSRSEVVRHLGVAAGRVFVTPWGVGEEWRISKEEDSPPDWVAPGLGGRRPYFVTASCSVGRKNTLAVLTAHRLAVERGLKADLVVVWDAPEQVRRAFPSTDVRFVPWQTNRQLRGWLASSLAFVWMTRAEGFGFPVLEAMACGAPVVCSDIEVLKEVAGETADYISPDDIEGLAARLLALADASEARAKMAAGGRERALQFTWRRCAERTAEVYRSVLGSDVA